MLNFLSLPKHKSRRSSHGTSIHCFVYTFRVRCNAQKFNYMYILERWERWEWSFFIIINLHCSMHVVRGISIQKLDKNQIISNEIHILLWHICECVFLFVIVWIWSNGDGGCKNGELIKKTMHARMESHLRNFLIPRPLNCYTKYILFSHNKHWNFFSKTFLLFFSTWSAFLRAIYSSLSTLSTTSCVYVGVFMSKITIWCWIFEAQCSCKRNFSTQT